MAWEFESNQPIYIQLVHRLKKQIVSGEIPKGSKLDSVRELALKAGVNPNTMQRALVELEREGLVYSQRTSGRFVTEDTQIISDLRENYAKKLIEQLGKSLLHLGYSHNEIMLLIEKQLKEMK